MTETTNYSNQSKVDASDSHPLVKTTTNTLPIAIPKTEFIRLSELIAEIQVLIPDVSPYNRVNVELLKLLDTISYTAPEILGRRWNELYEILTNFLPKVSTSEPNTEIWYGQVQQLWQAAIKLENTNRHKSR